MRPFILAYGSHGIRRLFDVTRITSPNSAKNPSVRMTNTAVPDAIRSSSNWQFPLLIVLFGDFNDTSARHWAFKYLYLGTVTRIGQQIHLGNRIAHTVVACYYFVFMDDMPEHRPTIWTRFHSGIVRPRTITKWCSSAYGHRPLPNRPTNPKHALCRSTWILAIAISFTWSILCHRHKAFLSIAD